MPHAIKCNLCESFPFSQAIWPRPMDGRPRVSGDHATTLCQQSTLENMVLLNFSYWVKI